jgi:hypothetical protein
MKYRIGLHLFFFLFVLFWLSSCENDDFSLDEYENSNSHLMSEARHYFEEYASIEMEGEPTGLHPGNIAPEWSKAKVFIRPETMTVNVPLITEATYEGSFYNDVDTVSGEFRDTYFTVMLQKLVVVKNLETDIYSCYIATIIPSEEYATKNRTKIDKMCYSGDPNSEFSGTIVYSTVTTNYTISVEKYINGILYDQRSLYYASADLYEYLNEMAQFLCSARINRNVRTMTKNGEFGGGGSIELPEVVITPDPKPTPPPPPPSLPPPYTPPTDPVMPPLGPPAYPPGYVPPTSPPQTGGGNSGSQQQYPLPKLVSPAPEYNTIAEEVNKIIPGIYEKLKKMGIDLSKYKLKIVTSCATNARKELDGTIGICAKFVSGGYTLNDQTSIMWHEIYHVENDQNYSMKETELTSPESYSNIPPEIVSYIKDVVLNGSMNMDEDYRMETSVTFIRDPQYYRNEIAAYEAEIRNGINASSSYVQERNYLLWVYRQKLIIANKYYNK